MLNENNQKMAIIFDESAAQIILYFFLYLFEMDHAAIIIKIVSF